jgi:hypothetical protein
MSESPFFHVVSASCAALLFHVAVASTANGQRPAGASTDESLSFGFDAVRLGMRTDSLVAGLAKSFELLESRPNIWLVYRRGEGDRADRYVGNFSGSGRVQFAAREWPVKVNSNATFAATLFDAIQSLNARHDAGWDYRSPCSIDSAVGNVPDAVTKILQFECGERRISIGISDDRRGGISASISEELVSRKR